MSVRRLGERRRLGSSFLRASHQAGYVKLGWGSDVRRSGASLHLVQCYFCHENWVFIGRALSVEQAQNSVYSFSVRKQLN